MDLNEIKKSKIENIKKGEIKFSIQKLYDLNKYKISEYEFLAKMYLQDDTLVSN